MSDLIASIHLILHGYLNQGYGTMRTAYEALDIVDLLATGKEEAAKWMFTEKGYAEFSQSAVRKRLVLTHPVRKIPDSFDFGYHRDRTVGRGFHPTVAASIEI